MQADPLYLFYSVLSSFLSQVIHILEALMLETHSCHVKPCEKKVLVYSRFMDDCSPHIHHWKGLYFWKSAFLVLEIWTQVNFLSTLLGLLPLRIPILGKQCFFFFVVIEHVKFWAIIEVIFFSGLAKLLAQWTSCEQFFLHTKYSMSSHM